LETATANNTKAMEKELAIKIIQIDAQIELLLTMPDTAKMVELLKKQKLEVYHKPKNFTTN
jgi:hypothetical protein